MCLEASPPTRPPTRSCRIDTLNMCVHRVDQQIHTHSLTHTHTRTHTNTKTRNTTPHTPTHTHEHAHAHTHTHTHKHTHTHTYTHAPCLMSGGGLCCIVLCVHDGIPH